MRLSPESVAMIKLTREDQAQMLAALVRDGLMKRRGRWYEVSSLIRLPEHVRRQVQAVKASTRGSVPTTNQVLSPPHPSKIARAWPLAPS
jgi:hypothetical protein